MDPLMPTTRAVHHWTTTNFGEAAPGVLTPLGMSLWSEPAERAARRALYSLGVFTRAEREPPPDRADWLLRPFYGRLAGKLEFMGTVGDRFPGTTGEQAIASLFGDIPPTMTFSPTRSRYGAIALRFPAAFSLYTRRLQAVAAQQDQWWREVTAAAGDLDADAARRLLAAALRRFAWTSSHQLVGIVGSVQPTYDALEQLIARTGVGDLAVLSGGGGAEMAVVSDIWRASRGELTVADVQANHGFHGPGEGEASSRVWREDPAPLETLIARYAKRPDSESPLNHAGRQAIERAAMQGEVLRAVPAWQRPAVARVMALAAQRLPQRGVAKRAFLQAIDAARAATRRLGEILPLDDPGDAFYLTERELLGGGRGPVRDLAGLVAERRAQRAEYERLEFAASAWAGLPEVVEIAPSEASDATTLSGTGVSAGVVEGIARVVTDPGFADVEDDEILIAATTDPSWSSIMFVSSALVVDLGGALSHAAVVARELQIPCVVNTGDGTSVIRSGDRVRVDGGTGKVDILERA